MKHLLSLMLAAGLAGFPTLATDIQFDLTNSLNYDGVGTQLEVTANIPGNADFLREAIGDHSVNGNRRAYTNQGSVTSGTALPDDGALGGYQISTAFDNGTDGLTKSNNTIHIGTVNDAADASVTITLKAGQQAQYSAINMLFVSERDADRSDYRSYITANYTDGSSAIVLDTGNSATTGPGGTFGGAGDDGNGGLEKTIDSHTFVNQAPGTGQTIGANLVLEMDRLTGRSGSTQSVRSGTAAIWEFDQDIAVDPTKTLESLTVTLVRAGVNRNHDLYIFAINGTPVPEPGSMALLSLGALALSRRRLD